MDRILVPVVLKPVIVVTVTFDFTKSGIFSRSHPLRISVMENIWNR